MEDNKRDELIDKAFFRALDEKHIVKDVRTIWDSNFERSIKFCKAPEELRILYSMALQKA